MFKLNSSNILVLDFDSTFIKLESLDLVLEISLENKPNKALIKKEIQEITNKGMLGQISFQESLNRRLSLASPTVKDLSKAIEILQRNISDSILNHKNWFEQNKDYIWIISGGFKELILPIVKDFNIKPSQVLANSFIFKEDGNFKEYDTKNLLAQDMGKVKTIKNLNIEPAKISIVGDGWTDYELKKFNLVKNFIYLAENINRKEVSQKADFIAKNFSQVLNFLFTV